jgi:hypothetical protein
VVGGSDYSKIAEQLGDGDEGRSGPGLFQLGRGAGSGELGEPWVPSKAQPCFCGAEEIEEEQLNGSLAESVNI